MPLQKCTKDDLPGYRYGETGACYTYRPGDEASRKRAKRKAMLQGAAIEASQARREGKSKYQVKEIRGEFSDVLVISELRGSYPNVAIAADVDYEGLIAGDDAPMFLTLPIGKAGVKSGNNRFYDEAWVKELERQTLANKPVGLMGHLRPEERATAFPEEAIHWIGVANEQGMLWGKGYIPPGPVRDRIRRYKAQGKTLATSIDAFAEGIWDESLAAYRMKAESLRLNQIDIAPADRAGIPDLASVPILTSEMSRAEMADLDEEPEMDRLDRLDIIQELTAEDARLLPEPVREAVLAGVAPAPEVGQLAQIREALGLDDTADVTKVVTEMQQAQETQRQAAITSRIRELVEDTEQGIKLPALRGMVTELVRARNPKTVQEAESLYAEVVASEHVKAALSATVRETMGPAQRTPVTPVQAQNGAKGRYFQIPREEKEA